MVGEVHRVGHLAIAQRAGGQPVELVRSPEEVVFLCFDDRIKRLVELHVLRSGTTLNSVAKRDAFKRARAAAEIRGSAFMRILDVGEDKGLVYYTTNLNDGEFVRDYIARRGALPAATALSLIFELLDDLIQLRSHRMLIAEMRLDRAVVSTLEDTFLQLRVYDYGLSLDAVPEDETEKRLVVQAAELIFLMLTGRECEEGDNPDRYPALSGLPMDLRTTIRSALTDPTHVAASLESLREDVREAYGALVSSIQARNSRKQLVVTPALQPRSQFQDLLLENVPVEVILGSRFRMEDADHVRCYPFSIPCTNLKTEQPVTVHLLPPSRVIDKAQYEAVPLQTWRFDSQRHPNILRSLSVWESPDWTLLTEEREPGFTVSRLMAERIFLNPAEVLLVMRQVRAGIEQALECGVQRVDLHPFNIVLRVGKAGPLLNREYERLMQKRLDAWPNFTVKVRAHLTMRNLYEPLLVEAPEEGELPEPHLADRDYRHRAFVSLAAYLLTGQRQTTSAVRFPEALPETLVAYVREVLEACRKPGAAPGPSEFLERFESAMAGPAVPDLATRLRGVALPMDEMESAGSVSDFDNEWASPTSGELDLGEPASPVARTLRPAHLGPPRKHRSSGPAWAAAAVVALSMSGWWWMSKQSLASPPVAAAEIQSTHPAPVAVDPPVEPSVAAAPVIDPSVPPTMVLRSDAPADLTAQKAPPPVFAGLSPKPTPAPPVAAPQPEPGIRAMPDPHEFTMKSVAAAKEAVLAMAGKPVMAELRRPIDLQPAADAEPVEEQTQVQLQSLLPFTAPGANPMLTRTLEAMVPESDASLAAADFSKSPPPAKVEPVPAADTDAAPAAATPPAPASEPVMIRRALMPSHEEVARFKRAGAEPSAASKAAAAAEAQAVKRQLTGR